MSCQLMLHQNPTGNLWEKLNLHPHNKEILKWGEKKLYEMQNKHVKTDVIS